VHEKNPLTGNINIPESRMWGASEGKMSLRSEPAGRTAASSSAESMQKYLLDEKLSGMVIVTIPV